MKPTLIAVYFLAVVFLYSVDGYLTMDNLGSDYEMLPRGDQVECSSHSQCAADRACQSGRCVDPCDTLCGRNTVCDVTDHVATCACVAGFHCACDLTRGCEKSRHMNSSLMKLIKPTTDGDGGSYLQSTTEKPELPKKKKFLLETDTKVNWLTALAKCYHQDMKLACILNKEENDQLELLIKGFAGIGESSKFWLAGTDLAVEGVWRWMTSGEKINYTSWLPDQQCCINQPSNYPGSDCMGAYVRHTESFGWFADSCDNADLFFICEYFE